MKKNTITKLMLILVMALLVFSLFACGPKNNNNGGSGSGKKTLDAPVVNIDEESGLAEWRFIDGAGSYRITVYNMDGTEKLTKVITDKEYQLEEGESIEVVAIPTDKFKDKYSESTKSEKKTYEPSTAKQLVNLLRGVGGIVNTWNNATTQLNADLAIGGFFESGALDESGKKKQNSFNIFAQANASKDDPEFMLGFKLNNTDYVSFGYKDNAIYVREPMNLVNILKNPDGSKKPTPAAQAYKIDISALSACVPQVMGPVMKLIASDATDLEIESMIDTVTELLEGELGSIANIFNVKDVEGKKVISATVSTLSLGVNFLKTMAALEPYIGAKNEQTGKFEGGKIDEYFGYFYKVTDALDMKRIQLNGKDITMDGILSLFPESEDDPKYAALADNDLLNIEVSYNGTDVSGLNLVIDLGALEIEGVESRFGLTISLEKFNTSATDTVNIKTDGFVDKNFEIDLGGALGLKGLAADAKAVLRLSDALKVAGNKWATLVLSQNNTDHLVGYIDATGAYVDFAPVFTILNKNYTGTTKYQATYLSDGANVITKFVSEFTAQNATNPIETSIDKLIAELLEKKANKGKKEESTSGGNAQSGESAQTGGNEGSNESDFSLMDFVMSIANGFGAAQNKVDYVCSVVYPFVMLIDEEAANFLPEPIEVEEGVFEDAPITQAVVIDYLFNRRLEKSGSTLADYVLFYEDGEGVAATTFKALGDNIKACHEAGKAALTAATNTTDTTAGVQLILDGENNDLLDYVSYFVKIPTIVGDEPNFEALESPNNKAALIGWLNWIFPEDNEYRDLVEAILGTGLDDIINDGLYLEAINDGGFHGTVRAAVSAEENAAEYVRLSAGFGMVDSVAAPAETITGGVEFTAKDTETGNYYIADMAIELLDALCDYGRD